MLYLLSELNVGDLFKINSIKGDPKEILLLARYNFREGKTFILIKNDYPQIIVEDYSWNNILCIRTGKVNVLCELLNE
jgi:hypothetical protein